MTMTACRSVSGVKLTDAFIGAKNHIVRYVCASKMIATKMGVLTCWALHACHIVHDGHLFLTHFIAPEEALHGTHSEEILLLQSCTRTLHLLDARAERAEDAIWS